MHQSKKTVKQFFKNKGDKNQKETIVCVDESHLSIQKISQNNIKWIKRNFKNISEDFIGNSLCIIKATGNDGISSKLVKLPNPSILTPLTMLVRSYFPR